MARAIEALLRLKAENQTLKAFGQVNASLDKIDKKARQVSRGQLATEQASRFDRVAASTQRAETAMLGYGRVVAAIATGVAANQIVTQAADFESRLTGIQKKAGLTGEQMAGLGDEIKALATSGKIAVSIEDIMGAYERGAAAGLPIDELKDFATLSAKAADAFEMSSEDIGNTAAGFKTAFKIDTSEVAKLFDLINALADSGISEEKDIVDFLDRSGASLKLFGQSQEQAAALGATLLNLKMPAEVASRAINTVATKLLSPGTDKAEAALKGIVKDTSKFHKLLQDDPNEALLLFLDRVAEMDKFAATESLDGLLGAGFSDEMLRLAKGVDEYRRNLKLANDETEWFGSLDKSYALKLDDFWSNWQVMKNKISTTAIDIGDMGMPALEASMEGIAYTVTEISKGMEAFKGDLDWPEITQAQEALSDLGTGITALLGTDTSQSAIVVFFRDMADAVNDIAAGINKVENSDLFKVITGNKQAAADVTGATVNPETGRLNKAAMDGGLVPGLTKWLAGATDSPDQAPGRIVYPAIRYNPVVPAFADAQPEGDFGKTTGEIALPHWRPVNDASPPTASLPPGTAIISQSPGPVPVVVSNIAELAPGPRDVGGMTAPSIGAREAEAASMAALRSQYGGMLNPDGQSFRQGTSGQDVIDEVDPDALRQAMEAGAQSVAQGGRDAQAAIDQGGARLPAQGQQAGEALAAAAGAGLVGQALAAGAAMAQSFNANVRVPAARPAQGVSPGGRDLGTSMPDAGN